MARILSIAPVYESHEEFFMARYERVRGWAFHLSGHDRERAEDLIQEAFVQFTLTGMELSAIENADAYLFGLLRILHLSRLRRSKRRSHLLHSAIDYDAAIMGLRTTDAREQLVVRDQLLLICRYACQRKETSKAGSVLLLRFFLGYYPDEIARLSVSTRAAVEERLRLARAEAKAYAADPRGVKFVGQPPGDDESLPAETALTADEFLKQLRRRINLSRRGVCMTRRQWESVYTVGRAPDAATLGHLASCPRCLDEVNALLGLPPLADRHPLDTLGKDTRGKGGGGTQGGGTGGGDDNTTHGGGTEDRLFEVRRCRRRSREVFEHMPRELCVAVNGRLLGSQSVGSALNEQTFNTGRKVEFVEVFSEQGVRLLLLAVGEVIPRGPFRHAARVKLSGGRTIEAQLDLNYPDSALRVVYRDPSQLAEESRHVASDVELVDGDLTDGPLKGIASRGSRGATLFITPDSTRAGGGEKEAPGGSRVAGAWQWLRSRLLGSGFWLRPGTVTAVMAILLVASLLLLRVNVGTVSAAELLRRASAAESAEAADTSVAVHRVINLEVLEGGGGPALRRRVEIWQSAARGVTVRRVYDEEGRAVIGEALAADGTRTVFTPGSPPADSRTAAPPAAAELLEAGAAWRLNLSASQFMELSGQADGAAVEERPDAYVLRRRAGDAGDAAAPSGVIETALTLRKPDLRAVGLSVVVVSREAVRREYRLTESVFVKQPADAAPPTVFEPRDAEARPAERGARPADPKKEAPGVRATAASPELEIEVNYLLHRGGADFEQVSVRRTADERLRVEALVETEARKRAVLDALRPVAGNPAVEVRVGTVAEAMKGRSPRRPLLSSVLEVEVNDDAADVDSELRRHFARRFGGDEERARQEVLRFSGVVVGLSRSAVQHAAALRRLTSDFSLKRRESLSEAGREKLLVMIRAHARESARAFAGLRRELLPLFPDAPAGQSDAGHVITGDAELARAAERMLRLAQSSDEAVGSAFTLSARGQTLARVRQPGFWASLDEAAALAAAITRAYQD